MNAITRPIKKLLIANRSEIALRIQATCRALGIITVVVYTKEDASCLYVQQADQAFELSKTGFAAFLQQDELIDIAQRSGADAVHPGYGFLAENADFAEKVIQSGLCWIGPAPTTMRRLGDKSQAKLLAEFLGVPVARGAIYRPNSMEAATGKKFAAVVGYPVIIKDSMGGGGKAMRRVYQELDFDAAWHAVLSEGKRLGFAGSLIVEKYVSNARHIEIQIAADGKRAIHLFERDCSIQRKHQKIIEQAPSTAVSPQTLAKMYEAATTIAMAVGYHGVGTVEFLVDEYDQFYFLEVNARLQVEHSVTEFVTGIDLVELQLLIAQHDALPISQEDVVVRGCAIECRIYAEDPFNNFTPSTGTISYLNIPRPPKVRVDYDLYQGYEITPFFDPMIAKLTAFGSTRSCAVKRMQGILELSTIAGLRTNIAFLRTILAATAFQQDEFHTQWLALPETMAMLSQAYAQQERPSQQGENVIPLIAAIAKAVMLAQLQQREQMLGKPAPATYMPWKGTSWK